MTSPFPYEGDVRNAEELAGAVGETAPTALVHLAALSSVGGSWKSPAETWEVNVLGTVNVLEALKEVRPRLGSCSSSTGEVYGRAEELPTPESARPAPLSPYAASKAAAEIACEQAARATGLDVVVARAFQHEGPGRDERFAIGSWTRQIAELEPGAAASYASATSPPSATSATCGTSAALTGCSSSTRCRPGRTTWHRAGRWGSQEVVDLLVESAQAPVEVVVDQARLRPSEIKVVWGDPSKLEDATGWRAEIPLEQTLADALAYARDAVSERVAKS